MHPPIDTTTSRDFPPNDVNNEQVTVFTAELEYIAVDKHAGDNAANKVVMVNVVIKEIDSKTVLAGDARHPLNS